jgi:hypothetical protein
VWELLLLQFMDLTDVWTTSVQQVSSGHYIGLLPTGNR